MTYIEFFDKTLIENICASLVCVPDRIILIGDKMKLIEKQAECYSDILKRRGYDVEVICRSVNKNNMMNIVDILSEIAEIYDDCVFDLTGGEELFLVAAGIIAERYKDKKIQMHRINIYNNSITDCDCDGIVLSKKEFPHITVEENVRIYGGKVVYEDEKTGTTSVWEDKDGFFKDVEAIWDICKNDVKLWNAQIGVFAVASVHNTQKDSPLTISAPVDIIKTELASKGVNYFLNKSITEELCKKGLATVTESGGILNITFKNNQVKKCLIKAGQALEMIIYVLALTTCEKDGSYTYNDVMNGVYIDWDGEIHIGAAEHDTENEIDVMMMHGMIPVFVSCKNGQVSIDELYKLETVASRFGGKYAKKVLIATALGNSDYAEYLRERAKDMGIRIVENITKLSDSDVKRVLKSLWCN